MAKVSGIIWVGPAFDVGGFGTVSRNCLEGFRRIGFPVKLVAYGADHRKALPAHQVRQLLDMFKADAGNNPVGIMHLAPEFYPKVRFKGVSRKIGYTIFETDRIPYDWVNLFNGVDQVWVPSKFNERTFSLSGVNKERLKVLPYGLDCEFYKPTDEVFPVGGKKRFSFLYTFAFDWRKGFDLLLEAYFSEFSASDDVSLILKVFFPDYSSSKVSMETFLKDSASRICKKHSLPHVVIIDKILDAGQLKRLYNTCDLYISTDRANGWGMPCMEAMAMAKSAATIDWSGSTEFMNETNSFLIKPTNNLVDVDERLVRSRPLYAGHKWIEVKVEEIRRVMRFACDNPQALKQIGQAAREDILNNFSIEKTARRAVDLLNDTPCQPQTVFVKPSCRIKRQRIRFALSIIKKKVCSWPILKKFV